MKKLPPVLSSAKPLKRTLRRGLQGVRITGVQLYFHPIPPFVSSNIE